jgi:hypothetical protein
VQERGGEKKNYTRMPLCLIYTNMKRGDLSDDFEERVAKCIAETAQFPLEVSVFG